MEDNAQSSSVVRIASHHAMEVASCVRDFNTAVECGDWGRLVEYFADDAVMTFQGPSIGPVTGKPAIQLAYRQNPPDDTIELSGPTIWGDQGVTVLERWAATRESGTMRFKTNTAGLITSLTISVG